MSHKVLSSPPQITLNYQTTLSLAQIGIRHSSESLRDQFYSLCMTIMEATIWYFCSIQYLDGVGPNTEKHPLHAASRAIDRKPLLWLGGATPSLAYFRKHVHVQHTTSCQPLKRKGGLWEINRVRFSPFLVDVGRGAKK